MNINKKILSSIALSALITTTPLSETHAKFSANAGAMSNYYFRGISQTQNKPAAYVGFNYDHKSGFYLGNKNINVSKVAFKKGYGLESDFFGGYQKDFKHVSINAGLSALLFPGAKTSEGLKYNTYQVYYGMEAGPLKAKVSQSIGKFTGIRGTDRTRYYEAELKLPIRSWVKFNTHIGYTDSPLGRSDSYYDTRTGFIFPVLGGDLGMHYYQTNLKTKLKEDNTLKGEKLYKNTFILSYGYTHSF